MQTWGDGQHTLPEGPGGLHAQEAGGCHQKGWQHHQVLVPTFYLNFFNSNCLIYVKNKQYVWSIHTSTAINVHSMNPTLHIQGRQGM